MKAFGLMFVWLVLSIVWIIAVSNMTTPTLILTVLVIGIWQITKNQNRTNELLEEANDKDDGSFPPGFGED